MLLQAHSSIEALIGKRSEQRRLLTELTEQPNNHSFSPPLTPCVLDWLTLQPRLLKRSESRPANDAALFQPCAGFFALLCNSAVAL